MQLQDLKIVVTGAAAGMGRHFTLELLRVGAKVAAGDVNAEALAALRDEARGLPGQLDAAPLDVADEASVIGFVKGAGARLGGLNALLNNAGILRDGLLVKRDKETGAVRTLSREKWQQVIDVNLTGAFLMAREVAAQMVERQVPAGVIVNMSSLARAGNRGQSNYSAAKAGLAADTRTWAMELAPYQIRVGAIAPGLVDTPILQGMPEKARAALIASVPIGRIGTPHDVFQAVKFIIECDYFTGRVVEVDGGSSM